MSILSDFPLNQRDPKISYTWWDQLSDCYRTGQFQHLTFGEYLKTLLDAGLGALDGLTEERAGTMLTDNSDICSVKHKTIKPNIDETLSDRVGVYCGGKNDRPRVVATCVRIGHDILCRRA